MSFYKVKYSKSAEKFIKKNKIIGLKFYKAFEELAEDRQNFHLYDIKKFYTKQFDDVFRLRIGNYRGVFRIVDQELIIFVVEIGARGDVYKKVNF